MIEENVNGNLYPRFMIYDIIKLNVMKFDKFFI